MVVVEGLSASRDDGVDGFVTNRWVEAESTEEAKALALEQIYELSQFQPNPSQHLSTAVVGFEIEQVAGPELAQGLVWFGCDQN
jgi:hypothetical protein